MSIGWPEVLDEATSALDVATEKLLYSILVERGVAVIRFLADTMKCPGFEPRIRPKTEGLPRP